MAEPLPSSNGHTALPDQTVLRQDEARARNARIGNAARRHHFDPAAHVPFICECDDERCDSMINLTLEEYDVARAAADYVVAPGHQVGHAHIVRVKNSCWLYAGERSA